jgi:hypothetical protein
MSIYQKEEAKTTPDAAKMTFEEADKVREKTLKACNLGR